MFSCERTNIIISKDRCNSPLINQMQIATQLKPALLLKQYQLPNAQFIPSQCNKIHLDFAHFLPYTNFHSQYENGLRTTNSMTQHSGNVFTKKNACLLTFFAKFNPCSSTRTQFPFKGFSIHLLRSVHVVFTEGSHSK